MKKLFIKFLKYLLKKLGGVKRVEYNMPDKDKMTIEEMNAIRKRYERTSFKGGLKSVELKEDFPENLQFFFDHNFKVNFDDIPSQLFTKARRSGQNSYEFTFFVAKYKETDVIEKFKSLIWKGNSEEKKFEINIEVTDGASKVFKTIKLDKCKIENIDYLTDLDYYSNNLAKGTIEVKFDLITME